MSIEGFALRKGDSYDWRCEFDDSIVDKTLTFTVKRALEDLDENALLQVAVTFPDNADSQAGIGWLFVPHTATATLPYREKVFYDFQLSFIDSLGRQQSKTMAAGVVKIDWEVTETVP